MDILFVLFTNTLDFGILYKYLQTFSVKRKFSSSTRVGMFVLCITVLSLIKQCGIPILNLLLTVSMIYLYSLSFSYPLSCHILLPALYIDLGFVTELIGLLLLRSLNEYIPLEPTYRLSVLLCEIIRYLLVLIICQSWKIQLAPISLNIGCLLFSSSISSVAIICIVIYMTRTYNTSTSNLFYVSIIVMVLLSNALTFAIFHKLVSLMQKNHKNELMLQEAKAKEQYYTEVKTNTKNIEKIKHDMKNRLLGICALAESNKDFSNELKKIVGELEYNDKKIYTSNEIFNTILSNKLYIAKQHGIKTSIAIMVPRRLNLDCSDAGILIGNLLDNAIEACEKVSKENQWISVTLNYRNHMLILKICNGKKHIPVTLNKSSKADSCNHGIGIQSVKRVVEKYNGVIEFEDKGQQFEVSAILYGISIISELTLRTIQI